MGREQSKHNKVRCPECLAPIWIKDTADMWDPITCPECHTALEIVNLHPLELDYLADWEDEEYEEE